jgi:hypothetical protein
MPSFVWILLRAVETGIGKRGAEYSPRDRLDCERERSSPGNPHPPDSTTARQLRASERQIPAVFSGFRR